MVKNKVVKHQRNENQTPKNSFGEWLFVHTWELHSYILVS